VPDPAPAAAARRSHIQAVVFDLGGVLVDWNPRHLYRGLFESEAEMERFLAEVTSSEWNALQDEGRPFAEAIEALAREHPGKRELIEAYFARWPEMLAGEVPGTVDVLAELRSSGVRLLALTNWSSETFPFALERYPFLSWFEAIVVSGDVRMRKPNRDIFEHLLERFGLDASRTFFVDDSEANVEAARSLGFAARRFVDAATLRDDLVALGVL
jgi:2-haloacid dehalogenase